MSGYIQLADSNRFYNQILQYPTSFKVMAYIPFIGIIPSVYQKNALQFKMQLITQNIDRLIQLIKTYNEFNFTDICRKVLQIACIVAAVAHGLFSSTVGVILVSSYLVLAAHDIHSLYRNKRLITELQTNGLRPGMKIL